MPVKKTSTKKKVAPKKVAKQTSIKKEKTLDFYIENQSSFFVIGDHAKKLLWTLVGILLVYVIIFTATLIRNNLEQYHFIGQTEGHDKTIVVSEMATVTMKPDVAMTNIGMLSKGETVKEAQDTNTKTMNKVIASLKKLGVKEADIRTTQYNVHPIYNYTEEGREENGFEVSQNLYVKIRNLDKANQVIAIAGNTGANSVGGLQFTIDDPEMYKQLAREEALQKVKLKASHLSNTLGVELVGVVGYNEFDGNQGNIQYSKFSADAVGAERINIQPGESSLEMTVSVTYQIR